MDWNPQTLEFLSQAFLDTLSPQPELRRRAEENLSAAADTPNYGVGVLGVVAEPSVDEQTRECAAVNFKNHLRTRWVSSSSASIPGGEKEQIKTLIVPQMLSATGKIQAQLSEAIAVIGHHDFPEFWPGLLPDLMSSLEKVLNANDFASGNCILATVNSLLKIFRCESSCLYKRFRCENSCLHKRFRNEYKSSRILLDLEYCSENLAAPLLSTVESISRKINGVGVGSVATLRELLEARRLCCKIFYSLNYLAVPEEFEDKEDEWMNEFKNYLTERYPAIEDGGGGDAEDCLSLVDEVQAAVCENISLYMEKKEEQALQKHLSDFAESVWSLVASASASQWLSLTGLKFLSMSVDRAGDEILQRILIPNVMLRDEDEGLFEKNCGEFIRRDMEDHLNAGRRIACELLKKGKNKEKIIAQIHRCLALFAENPAANWKYKECAIYLVVSTLATAGGSGSDLVDVESFFRSVIVPELQGKDVNAFPMLKAAALKFFTVFRVFIPKHAAMPLVGDVVRFVSSDDNVVQSYAVICIEKLLLVKDKDKNGVLQARYTSMDIDPIHGNLLCKLVGALEKAPYSEEEEYVYIMRCMMRVFQIADDISLWWLSECMTGLTKALNHVMCCYAIETPVYIHFLFEAAASVVRRVCEKGDPRFVNDIQSHILREFDPIWSRESPELFPYALQLVAQLVDLNRHPVPGVFMGFIDKMLLDPDVEFWERSANVPALVRLLRSFLQQAPDELLLNREGRLACVVRIINKLVSSPTTEEEEEGFHLLNTVIETYPYGVIAEYMKDIWASLFPRLQTSKTPTLVRCVIIFISLFLVKHGVQTLVDLVEVNSFHDVILGEFWIPYLKIISSSTRGYNYNYTEVKLIAVASTRLLCESASLLDPAAEELWGKLLDAIVTLLSLPLPLPLPQPQEERERVGDDDDDFDFDIDIDFGRFVPLQNAGGKTEEDWDPLKEIEDPKQFLVAFPANLSSQFSGIFPRVSMTYLSPPNQAALVKLCHSYGIAVV